jgi:hypothetical protein
MVPILVQASQMKLSYKIGNNRYLLDDFPGYSADTKYQLFLGKIWNKLYIHNNFFLYPGFKSFKMILENKASGHV